MLTQTLVDPGDPAFGAPSKPIGPVYSEVDGRRLVSEHGWSVAPDGDGFRRVVASPEPGEIVEARTIALLVHAGVLVVCAGGGGIPVTSDDGVLRGVEAVVDKVAAALLARRARAQALLLLTDAAAIVRGERGTVVARDPAR